MNAPANVHSVEAVRDFRGSLQRFGEQATDCLDSLHAQVHRMIDWLEHDRPAYWQQQVRTGYDRMADARQSLQRCQMKTVGDHRPSCIEEKQALARAKARLEYSQHKLEVVRRCQRVVGGGQPVPRPLWTTRPLAAARRAADDRFAGPHTHLAGGVRGSFGPRTASAGDLR